jgi:hypothetical protein
MTSGSVYAAAMKIVTAKRARNFGTTRLILATNSSVQNKVKAGEPTRLEKVLDNRNRQMIENLNSHVSG